MEETGQVFNAGGIHDMHGLNSSQQVFQMIWSPDSLTDKTGKVYQYVLCTVSKDGRTRAWVPNND